MGRIDTIGRIFMSNNLNGIVDGANTTYYILVLHRDAVTFASQMTKMQTLPSTATFGELMRGLQIYGFKTMKDQGLASVYVRSVPAATALE